MSVSIVDCGRIEMPAYSGVPTTQTSRVPISLSVDSEIFLQARGRDGTIHEAHLVDVDTTGFTVGGDGSTIPYTVSWFVMVKAQ